MLKLKWLKPDILAQKGEENIDLTAYTYLVIQHGDFVNTRPFDLFRQQGYLHIIEDDCELILWDTDKVKEPNLITEAQ